MLEGILNSQKHERERERESVSACVQALLQYRALDQVLYKWPYLGTRMARVSLRFFAIQSDSLFLHII